jgi:hypothetical protein|tara:strand:+ start:75 stop:434 length:360 start_codon:yes stop_codon:yes gene_type:complete
MKELNLGLETKEKVKVEISQEKEDVYELIYQGTIIPHENHTLWEIDIKTKKIKEAKYFKKDYIFNPNFRKGDKISINSEIIINEGKVYVSALNKPNAIKKMKEGNSGSKFDPKKSYLSL